MNIKTFIKTLFPPDPKTIYDNLTLFPSLFKSVKNTYTIEMTSNTTYLILKSSDLRIIIADLDDKTKPFTLEIQRYTVTPTPRLGPKSARFVTFYNPTFKVAPILRSLDWQIIRNTDNCEAIIADCTDIPLFKHLLGFASNKTPEQADTILLKTYKEAKDAYYSTGKSSLSDAQFDNLEEYLTSNNIIQGKPEVGAKAPATRVKESLPFQVGSLDKVKTTQEISSWIKKAKANSFLIMPKKDGVSILLSYKAGNLVSAHTRGDGSVGSNVTNILKSNPQIPQSIKYSAPLLVRMEAIMPKSVFDKKYSKTASLQGFKNPRNMVAGILNRKTEHAAIKDINLFALDVMDSKIQMSKRLLLLKSLGFNTIPFTAIQSDSAKTVQTALENSIKNNSKSDFETDGVVITVNDTNSRGYETNSLNPVASRAYKPDSLGTVKQTTVTKVEWAASRTGYLKPVIHIEPVMLSGAEVKKTSGFNAAYIRDNNIGPGTVIKITRSGDVIPYITEVVKSTRASMPSKREIGRAHV